MNQINIIGRSGGPLTDYCQVINTVNAFPNPASIALGINIGMPPNLNTPVAGVVGLGLFFGLAPGATSPSINMFGVEAAALGVYGDIITVSVLGVNHNYKLQQGVTFGAVATTVMLTRYE